VQERHRRGATPQETAYAVLSSATDESAFFTATDLVIDGRYRAH
jgi:hypothetical protein